MTARMNPPPLGVVRISQVAELKRILSMHLRLEVDASPMWNEYVWSYAILFYTLFFEHFSSFPDFSDRAEDAARHNAVVTTIDVISRQMYNFNSLKQGYEKNIFDRLGEHIQREKAKHTIHPPSSYENVPTLTIPIKTVAQQLTALKRESGFTYEQLAEGIGTNITTVQRHFSGKLKPRSDKIDLYEKKFAEKLRRPVKIETPQERHANAIG